MASEIALFDDGAADKDKEDGYNILEGKDWLKSCKYELIDDIDTLIEVWKSIPNGAKLALDTETQGLNPITDRVVGLSFAWVEGVAYYVPLRHTEGASHNLDPDRVWRLLKELVIDRGITIITWNGKFDCEMIFWDTKGELDIRNTEDAQIAVYQTDMDRNRRIGLKQATKQYLGIDMIEIHELFGPTAKKKGRKKTVIQFETVHPQLAVPYAAADADMTLRLYIMFSPITSEQNTIWRLDNRLLHTLRRMERNRMSLDQDYYRNLEAVAEHKIQELADEITKLAGTTFDLNSSQQLEAILFDKLGIPYPDDAPKTKTGRRSTSDEILSKLTKVHPIIKCIQEYRSATKLLSTYIKPFFENIDAEGTGRFNFKQVDAETGRLAASAGGDGSGCVGINVQSTPNANGAKIFLAKKVLTPESVQDVMSQLPEKRKPPISLCRSEGTKEEDLYEREFWSEGLTKWVGDTYCLTESCVGCKHPCKFKWDVIDLSNDVNIRKGFKARDGFILFAIDYKAIEVRVAANMSEEPVWITAINNDEDLHKTMAKLIYKVESPSKNQRSNSKAANFLILYGGEAYRLSVTLNISKEEAIGIIEEWKKAVPRLQQWLEIAKHDARRSKIAKTAFGRKRIIGMYDVSHLEDDDTIPPAQKQKMIRSALSKGDRDACNYKIQGSSADLIKLAMLQIDSLIEKNNYQDDVHLLLTVHDELVLEIREEKIGEILPKVVDAMTTKYLKHWQVGLEVDIEASLNWGTVYAWDTFKEDLEKYWGTKFHETPKYDEPPKEIEAKEIILLKVESLDEDYLKKFKNELNKYTQDREVHIQLPGSDVTFKLKKL